MTETLRKYRVAIISLLLACATVSLYAPAIKNDFIDFDDDRYVTENPHVQTGLTFSGVKWAFTTTHAFNYHPLVWLSHMLDCQIFGLNPAGHHLTSILFHAANTVLLFLILYSMTAAPWPAAFVAALFAIHPLHVESVAWVSERKDVLSTFLWLATISLYLRYVRRPAFTRYLPVILCFALGLLAKQMLVTLPVTLVLLDYWPLGRLTGAPKKRYPQKPAAEPVSLRRSLIEKLPLFALSVAAAAAVFLIQSRATLVKTATEIPPVYRLANAVVAAGTYILKTFWPADLAILYPHPGTSLPLGKVLPAALLLTGISLIVTKYARRQKYLPVGWLWYLITLLPVIGIIQVGLQQMADRYTYVPLIGIFIIIAWTAAHRARRSRAARYVVTCIALIWLAALALLTIRQISYWQDSITLYRHTVAVTKNNDIIHRNLAILLLRQGETEQAVEHFQKAVELNPKDTHSRKLLEKLRADKQASDTDRLLVRANALAQQGRLDQAIRLYREFIELRPDSASVYNNLGNALFLKRDFDKARDAYSTAIRLDPNYIDAHSNLAILLARTGQTDRAAEHYRKVFEIDPDHAGARKFLDSLKNGELK